MIQILLSIAAAIIILLGGFHGFLTIRDLYDPRSFTPTDDSVRKAMQNQPIRLHPSTDLWKAWLGFNLSHSLGLLVAGGTLLAIALFDPELFINHLSIQLSALAVAGIYLVLSLKFWFSSPAIGSGIITLCIFAAILLA